MPSWPATGGQINPDEFEEFGLRVQNWVSVAGLRGWQSGHCGSLEHRYTAPRDKEDKRKPRWDPDVLDAWWIEDCWRTMPERHRLCVAYHFHRGWSGPVIARRLHVHITRFDDLLWKSRIMLFNRAG